MRCLDRCGGRTHMPLEAREAHVRICILNLFWDMGVYWSVSDLYQRPQAFQMVHMDCMSTGEHGDVLTS